MSKPKIILDLEGFYNINLFQTEEFSYSDNNQYTLDQKGNVKQLNLSGNKITDLKPLQNLTTVTALSLDGNEIKDLTPLQNLTKLVTLSLDRNQIVDISPLQSLIGLSSLYMADNKISDLKPLENIKNLYNLWLSNNRIVNIKPLKHLTNLLTLELDDNELTHLNSLQGLVELTFLSLKGNKIVDIHPLQNLKRLATLRLIDNQITDIVPIKNLLLKGGTLISLQNNPLEESLLQIFEIDDTKNKKSTLDTYFQNLAKGEKPLNEAKLMLLGEGEAGKSNLRNYLMGLAFEDNKSATVGIAIDKWKLKKNNTDYRINIWDFGGQWLQQQVHKFFITNESLYVIVLKPRTEDKPNVWLDWIKVYAPNSKAIIVVNRMDDLNDQSFSLTENNIKKEYSFVIGFHYISLKDSNLNHIQSAKLLVEHLRNQIEDELTNLPNINTKTPKNYFDLKTELEDEIFINRPFISIEYFQDIVLQKGISGDINNLLNVFDRIGTLRYFKNTSRYILNPEWLSAGVYKLITNKRTEELKGVLKESDFKDILQKCEGDKFEYKETDYAYLREMMKAFNLTYIDPFSNTCFIPKQFEKDIPSLLVEDKLFEKDYIDYYFQYEGYFPDSLISQFIAEKYNKVFKNYYWQQGIVLQDLDEDLNEDTLAYVRTDAYRKRIEISVKGENRKSFFKEIKQCLKNLQKDFDFNYTEIIVDIKNNLAIDYKKLLVRYNNKKISYDEVTEDGIEVEVNIAGVLGTIQRERETNKEAQTIINDNRKFIINNKIEGDYHNKGKNYNNQFNFYDYAPEYTDIISELEKATKNLSPHENEELNSIIKEFDQVPIEKEPAKSKNLFSKALDRIKNFPKTVNNEAEKEVAKAIIRSSWEKLTAIYHHIDWNSIVKHAGEIWEKGKEFL